MKRMVRDMIYIDVIALDGRHRCNRLTIFLVYHRLMLLVRGRAISEPDRGEFNVRMYINLHIVPMLQQDYFRMPDGERKFK